MEKEKLSDVVALFRDYMGSGLIVIWFLAALLYLGFREKRKQVRIMFLYVPVMLLLLFFNPLFAKIVYEAAGTEIYYRILWLIPITVVIAYASARIWGELAGRKRRCFAAAVLFAVTVSGSCIYGNPYFKRAENLYHMPQSVVDICDEIVIEGREVMAVFPSELLQYVRQYTPLVCMPYGREILVSSWGHQNELYNAMEAEQIDAKLLATLAREQLCVYIILPEEKELSGSLLEEEFEEFGRMHGYVIYKDSTVDLTAFRHQAEQ